MTFTIIEDTLKTYPYIIEQGKLIIKSDNAAAQYKSKYIFYNMKQFAYKYNIEVWWFYGEPGHGRGVVDGMSSFGCKVPLRDAVITNDMWFSDAKEMVLYLEAHFIDDDSNHYHYIDTSMTAPKKRKTKHELNIAKCKAMHEVGF